MPILGSNIVPDAGFDAPGSWTLGAGAPDGVSEIVGGELHIANGPGSETVSAIPVPSLPKAIGETWVLSARVRVNSGIARIGVDGQNLMFSQDGIRSMTVVLGAISPGFAIVNVGANLDAYFEWVSVRKVGFGMSKLVMQFRDYDGDKRQTSIQLGDVTDGATYTTQKANADTLSAAIEAVVAGNTSAEDFVATNEEPNDVNATDFVAQSHIRWIVEYLDAVTGDGPYQIAVPTPDLADNTLVLVGTNQYDPANAEWVTLIAALEASAQNPRTGNGITVSAIFLEE